MQAAKWTAQPGSIVIATGLTVAQAVEFRSACETLLAATGDVNVDCGAAAHLDTAILQVLTALRIALEKRGRRLTLSGINPDFMKILRGAGLDTRFGPGGQP